jgi:dihydropteroate synthase
MSVQLVGVLNVTPDSFSDGGDYLNAQTALKRVEELFVQGASIVDIGGEATNPWAEPISINEEWRRLEPIVQVVLPTYPGKISIDTRHPEIVERAAQYGDFIVNDVTSFIDPAMITVTATHGLKAILSHLPIEANGDIQRTHKQIKLDTVEQVRNELLTQKTKLIAGGIPAHYIILDPGIGFGKSMRLNWQLLEFAKFVPDDMVMIGHSRKRFLATDPQTGDVLPGVDRYSAAINVQAAKTAIASGAKYLRVHDVTIYKDLVQNS